MISRIAFKQSSRNIDRGFTLLEVLVSLTIMAMIMTVAFTDFAPGQTPVPALKQTFDAVSMDGFRYLYSVREDQYDWFSATMTDNPAALRVDISGDVLTVPVVNRK